MTASAEQPDSQTVDTVSLSKYLEAQLPGFRGPVAVKKFATGQSNPTYLLQATSGKYVLRKKPAGTLLKSAHAVDREFTVISGLAGSAVPVAPTLHLCTDPSVIGAMFYLMGFVEGRIFWDAALPELNAADRPAIYDSLNRTLAALHSVDLEAAGLENFGKPGNYFERQISRWSTQYLQSQTEDIEAMNELLKCLPTATPPDDGRVSLIHGDYRIDNLIFHPQRNEASALIDWELSTLGHPMADLAYFIMSLRLPGMSQMKGLAGKDRASLNIPDENQFIEQYCRYTGVTRIEHWPFYLAFSYFRLAAIVQGVMKRALSGNASSAQAMEVGRMTRPLAQMGLAALQSEPY